MKVHIGCVCNMKNPDQTALFSHFYVLLHFYFCSNRITRDGARCLAGVLTQNETLQILDLSFNRIQDDGAVCLSEAIAQKHTKLRASVSLPVFTVYRDVCDIE